MKESIYTIDNEENDDSFFLKENILKYIYNWPWFLLSIVLCVLIGFIFLRYAPVIYATQAKIKIVDDSKEFDIAEDALSLLGGGSKINLDNEIAIIKSYRIVEQVVNSLNLDVKYYEVGSITSQQIFNAPLNVIKLFPEKNFKEPIVFKVLVQNNKVKVTDAAKNTFVIDSSYTYTKDKNFPVEITLNENFDFETEMDKEFLIEINNKKKTVLKVIDMLSVNSLSAKSDVLTLKMENESSALSEAILNELIAKFNTDGIVDRQLVSKRTLDFIDNRFLYLSNELDSIEVNKKEYKQTNNLSYIQADAGMTIEKKSISESEVFRIETQIELSEFLMETLKGKSEYGLLPADIGVENTNINSLVYDYNAMILQREKLVVSAGVNNPAVQLLSSQLRSAKSNIVNTVATYQNQLKISLRQLQRKMSSAGAMFSQLPEKEKMLRAIERQQSIKENLFLLLLQKREEAAINFAVTAPSVKVVDYGLTSLEPISPKKIIILGASLMIGLIIPLAYFFIKYFFDNKIKTKSDLEKITTNIPILAEIPFFNDSEQVFDPTERSIKAESFRILSTNVNYLLPKKDKSHIVYVNSAIKGEGKTMIAINLAMAYASLHKKVLLIGADLRNPQLHTYFNVDKETKGLSDYLYDPEMDWKDCIQKSHSESDYFEICFSGKIPPNAAELISGANFKYFLDIASDEYDYIVVDTAPSILVADTMLISDYADVTVFVTRSGFTDKRLIQFSKGLYDSKKLKNMAYVLNDVKFDKKRGYNYGYEYGYGSDES